MRILRPIFGKLGPVKGCSTLPIHGYRCIFNMMSDLTADGRTQPAVRIVKAQVGGGQPLALLTQAQKCRLGAGWTFESMGAGAQGGEP